MATEKPSRQPAGRRPGKSVAAPSPKLSVLAGVAALLLAGMVSGASLWVMTAIAAGVLMAFNYAMAKTWSTGTIAARHGGDLELDVGDSFPVEITLTNHGKVPVIWMLVEDLLPKWATFYDPPTLQVDGNRVAVMMLWTGKPRKLRYQVTCNRRGYFQIGPTILETGDVMGFYRRYRVGNQPHYVTVLPRVLPLSTYEIGSRRPIGEIRMRENIMEDPTRLRGIRRWEPGDPMRSIHWAATARTGTLHSKIYEPSSIIGATLVLDLHESTTPIHHEPVRSDLAVTAAASIAGALHEANEPVGLATNARDAADRIREEGWVGDHRVRGEAKAAAAMRERNERLRPVILSASRGPAHLQNVLRALARLERTDGLTMPELLVECESQLAADTTLLVILQQASEATIAALIGLERRGRAVAVIINTHDINDYSAIAGPLIAARIPTFHLSDEASITDVCREAIR